MNKDNWTFNIYSGGQLNIANDTSTINVNNQKNTELDELISSINNYLYSLKEDEIEVYQNTLCLIEKELKSCTPEKKQLKKYVGTISSLITIANGTPALVENLHKLVDYIMQFI